MNETTMKQLCHRHFLETCRRLSSTPGMKIRDERQLVNLAIHQSSPYFYVSPHYALQRIYQLNMDYTGTMARMRPLAREMWTEIYRQVSTEVRRRNINYRDAVEKVLRERRAPRYYFEEETGLLIRRRSRSKRNRRP